MHSAYRGVDFRRARKRQAPKEVPTPKTAAPTLRTIADASHNGAAAYAKRALSATRSLLEDTLALNSRLVEGSATEIEALLKAGFALQNAILAAAPSAVDASFGASKSVLQAYPTMADPPRGATPFNEPVGRSSCTAAPMLKQIHGDRRRLMDAADVLLAALKNARSCRELHHIRGELASLRANVEHMRHLIERQPGGGLDMWVF
jgi:hypothetical protein